MSKRTGFKSFVLILLIMLCLSGKSIRAEASSGYTIYVNRKSNIINVVNRSGRVVRSMYCSTGKGYATIKGTYYTQNRMRWHALFHGVYGQYCTRIHGHYLFHSVCYASPRKNQLLTKEYNRLGTQASAGCVRLAVIDAKWIYDHCKRGTKVVIGESRKMKKPSRKKIRLSTSSRTGWDPTDPDSSNPYRPKIKLKKGVSKKIKYGSAFDPLEKISVSSRVTEKEELMDNVTIKGKVKVKKTGKYKLVYTLKDPNTLLSRTLKVTYTVGKKPAAQTTEKEADQTETMKDKE